MNVFAGIEAGGTKFNCMLAANPGTILAECRIPTTSPGETLSRVIEFFRASITRCRLHPAAIGIASFGPLNLDTASPNYGSITSTPKIGWSQTPFLETIRQAFPAVPIAIDTDVTAAAMGEQRWGAAQGLTDFIYLTIGTGIGGGAIIHNRPLHGTLHPEMGHLLVQRDPVDDPFEGVCRFHRNCLEGLASGPAIEKRWGKPASDLPPGHPAWELESNYLAQALHSLVCVLSPQRIILGGGVMHQSHLFPLIRRNLRERLGGYIQACQILEQIDRYIIPPGLGDQAGILGAIALAEQASRLGGD